MNMRAIHNNNGKGRFIIYEEKPGDIYNWINQGQDIENVMFGTGYGKSTLGKEIFDGDIVTIEKTIRYIISYEPTLFMFVAVNKSNYKEWFPLKDIINEIDSIVGTIYDTDNFIKTVYENENF